MIFVFTLCSCQCAIASRGASLSNECSTILHNIIYKVNTPSKLFCIFPYFLQIFPSNHLHPCVSYMQNPRKYLGFCYFILNNETQYPAILQDNYELIIRLQRNFYCYLLRNYKLLLEFRNLLL